MTTNALTQWTAEAQALPVSDERPKQPIYVMTGEAYDLAALAKKYWKTSYSRKRITQRGLDLLGDRLPESIIGELISLSEALQQSHSGYLLTTTTGHSADLVAEGQRLVAEIDSVLRFFTGESEDEAVQQQLANVESEHASDPATPDAVAGELDDFAALADPHRKELDGFGGFDVGDIDHAVELARSLRALPAGKVSTDEGQAEQKALDLRNRVARLLQARTTRVRQAGRFVFRDQPEIARLFSSNYERKRRAARRSPPAPVAPAAPGTPVSPVK
jgi:hypothetical protein